jgi:hypothetical protein
MALLEFTVQSFTANELAIKVKNTSGASLDETITIEIYPAMYLVSTAVNGAAIKAASNQQPPGAMRLDGIVSGPEGWSIWARREASDSTLIIVLLNDRDQKTGAELSSPVKFPAGAESIIRIPLNPEAKQDNIELSYSYTHDDPEARNDGKLQLKSTQEKELPVVTLTTDAKNPTMVSAGDLVRIKWKIPNGVSGILRGPLPGDNSELTLSSDPTEDFKIAEGSLQVRVVGLMNYLLQAEVKVDGKPNVQVVKMLTLDTANKKHIYIGPREGKVLPHGLIEIDWAAWGVPQVIITAGDATRVIKLTQQTFGGSFEGSGVMRVSAGKSGTETVLIEAKPESKSKRVLVTSWQHMTKPDITGHPFGLAVSAPKIALLTMQGLYIADVGKLDPSPALKKLMFVKKTPDEATEWFAVTALGNRFFCMKRKEREVEVAPFTLDGTPDAIPPLTLPRDLAGIVMIPRAAVDFVGFGERIYIVADFPRRGDYGGRRAYSVGFDWNSKKAAYRPEPLLDNLVGFELVTFDNALYALNRETGQMFRFELTKAGTLGPALHAASAVRKVNGEEKSMIREGLIVPVGRVLVVLSPTSVPTLDSLEEYDLHNVLNYDSNSRAENAIPQDLVYNPQKNYWARCGHDVDVKPNAVATFRDGESPRLWVVQPDGETHTLPVGSESLFVRDYVLDFPTKPLSPYLNKKRKFTIKAFSALGRLDEKYRQLNVVADVTTKGPSDISALPGGRQVQFDGEIGYHQQDPAFVKLMFQLARRPQQRADVDYLLDVTFSGEDLSTAISHVLRASSVEDRFIYDLVIGSGNEYLMNSIVEVPRPARFDEHLRFVIVNASEQFRLKLDKILSGAPPYVVEHALLPINHDTPDFSLNAEGKIATEGVLRVNLNFALEHGIEASPSNQRQTKMIRLNTDKAQKLQVLLVKMLMPGDTPLKLKGTPQLIEPMSDRPVLVCHLDYKM